MKFDSIAEIFSANDDAHSELKHVLADVTEDRSNKRIYGEAWNIAEIVEHISIVDEGASKICAKLLGKAEAAAAASVGVTVSDNFLKHYSAISEVKLEAPDRVKPTGEQTVAQSLSRIDENRARLRDLIPRFESSDGGAKFPHPYFGDMTAVEWLILIGGHERRHTEQIRRLLAKH